MKLFPMIMTIGITTYTFPLELYDIDQRNAEYIQEIFIALQPIDFDKYDEEDNVVQFYTIDEFQ